MSQHTAVAVLASGTGTILSSLIAADITIDVVVVDRPCRATEIATAAGIPAVMVERTDFTAGFDRDAYTKELIAALDVYAPSLVVLAGFGTIVSGQFVEHFPRVINTHPALLPAFKGWHAVRDALAAGVSVTGCTVHYVTAEVDEGPILAQESVPVLPGDTESSLHERIKVVERTLLANTIKQLLSEQEIGN